jgi:hypothetical protein
MNNSTAVKLILTTVSSRLVSVRRRRRTPPARRLSSSIDIALSRSSIKKDEFDFQAHRVIFCGSVLRHSFPFERIRGRFTPPIINEVSARDPWPAIAKNITSGYGAVGTRGFNNSQVNDRWHLGFGHSQYLTETFCKTFWIPFFESGKVVSGASVREQAPLWCRGLWALTNKYFWIVLAAALFVSWRYL